MFNGKKIEIPQMAAIAMLAIQAVRVGWIARLPESLMVQRIPDDAFYYLVLAKNFAAHGRWSFDGTAPTSGFHLLWGYLLAAVFLVWRTIPFHVLFVLCAGFLACLMSAAAYWITSSVERLFGKDAAWGSCVVLFSGIALVEGTWLMEVPLLLFFAAACFAQLVHANGENGWHQRVPVAFCLGVLGTLSRSDFGLLPLWLSVTCLLASRGDWRAVRARLALAQLVGAACGVAAVFAHTHWISGHTFQASAEVKVYWGKVQGLTFAYGLHALENLFNPFFNAYDIFHTGHLEPLGHRMRQLLLLLVIGGCIVAWRKTSSPLQQWLLMTMPAVAVSYIALYRFDAALQDWYAVQFIVPMCVLAGAAWTALPKAARGPARVVVMAFVACTAVLSVRAHAPWQEATYQTASLVRAHPEWEPVGTWNSGVMSYFSGEPVVNMDGLVNDDLLPYIRSGKLGLYLAKRRITHLIESPYVWEGLGAARSGLGDGRVARCIDAQQTLLPDDPDDRVYGEHLHLYHLDAACLEKIGSEQGRN